MSSHAKPSDTGAACEDGTGTPAAPQDERPAADVPTPAAANAPHTLCIDIGGTYMKASVVDSAGTLLAAQLRTRTPKRATPDAVLGAIAGMVVQLPPFDRISVGFPGVVRGGAVLTAPNLGTEWWTGYDLIAALAKRYGTPVRMLNDAAVQGLGVVEGEGLECVLTLGTGIGCALFRNRRLLLHLEFGQLRAKKGTTYDRYIGQAALEREGPKRWNRRVLKAIGRVTDLTSCDRLYIGGGNSRKITVAVPSHVKIVSNTAGLTGGVRLWEPELEELFAGVGDARAV